MIGIRSSRDAPRQAAVLLRLLAFLVVAASVVVVPSELAAAAAGRVAASTAFAVAGVMSALAFASVVLARGLDPLRT